MAVKAIVVKSVGDYGPCKDCYYEGADECPEYNDGLLCSIIDYAMKLPEDKRVVFTEDEIKNES